MKKYFCELNDLSRHQGYENASFDKKKEAIRWIVDKRKKLNLESSCLWVEVRGEYSDDLCFMLGTKEAMEKITDGWIDYCFLDEKNGAIVYFNEISQSQEILEQLIFEMKEDF